MADFGYDVADYCDVHPLFGSLADLDALVAAAHARGLRVLLDFVPNHTSDRHPWFVESRASRASAKRGWYVWRDPKPDGSPPNNWRSVFGGPAWELDQATGQYYLHSFLKEQPDLDWRNPEVERAMHGVLRFWLDRGVDGFRIDVIQRIAKHPDLPDDPPKEGDAHGQLWPVYEENHPDVHPMLRRLRALLDAYEDRMLVGEVYLLNQSEVAGYYGAGDELHLAFNFRMVHAPFCAERLGEEIERMERALPPEGWPTLVLSSHDAPRHASRFDHPVLGEARARVAAMLLLTARGTPFLYQGEEIGMRNVPIPAERLQDPLARTLHPNLSRDPQRTPMQWEPGPGAGFTAGEPWLPLAPDADARNVAALRDDPRSLLHLYRALLALRRAEPALHAGDVARLGAPAGVLAYERRVGAQRALVALNFGDEPAEVALPEAPLRGALSTDPDREPPAHAGRVRLGAAEGVVLLLA
jgi:alpha-glucosidase